MPFNSDSRRSEQFSSQRQSQNARRRSRSPQHRRSRSKERPNYHQRCLNDRQEQDFSYGTNPKAHPVCAVCLGTHAHNVYACKAPRTWDGRHATSSRRHRGDLRLRENDAPLCMDWQRLRGCSSTKHDPKHLCSGCSTAAHGAHGCPRAQKD